MNCAEAEILICDYATLAAAERSALEQHLGECPACAGLARDSAEALAFIERAAEVELPPELVTRILFHAPWDRERRRSRLPRWLADLRDGFLQPKFALSMALTVLSLGMLARFVVPARQLRPADLRPSEVWAGIEDRAVRAWARTVKFYENLKVVYQIQTTIEEWQQQSAETAPVPKPDEHRLPVKPHGGDSRTPEGQPGGAASH